MHACILRVLSVRLSRVRTNSSFSILLDESYMLAQWYTANHNRSKCFVSVISEFLFESTDSYRIPYLYMWPHYFSSFNVSPMESTFIFELLIEDFFYNSSKFFEQCSENFGIASTHARQNRRF